MNAQSYSTHALATSSAFNSSLFFKYRPSSSLSSASVIFADNAVCFERGTFLTSDR